MSNEDANDSQGDLGTSAVQRVPELATGTMLRAVVAPGQEVRLEEAPIPALRDGEALVRSAMVGICGSDTHALAGQHPFLTGPYVPGHEAVGEIVDVAAGVDEFEVGQRVLLKPNVSCGACVNCRADRTNACESLAWIGCDPSRVLSGAMAHYFVAPASNLYRVPASLTDREAAVVECLATPVHAARIAGDLSGAAVAVLGAGTIGLLCVVAALQAGARSVIVTDMEPAKVDRAVRAGAAGGILATSERLTEDVRDLLGGPADVVFDCVANERSLDQGVGLLRRAGTLLVVGVPPRRTPLALPLVQDWELRVQGSAAYTHRDIVSAIEIMQTGAVPIDDVISTVLPLSAVRDAFGLAGADSSGKVMITPWA